MRNYDQEEAEDLKAEPWQLALLKLNPEYCSWGPYEDYMCGDHSGWDSPKIFDSWEEFGPWQLNDLNECVNFYFEVTRPSEDCSFCGGNGYHEKAQSIVNSFYEFQCSEIGLPRSSAWHDKITEDENDALKEAKRHNCGSTAEETNALNRKGGMNGHDAINRHILIKARVKRLNLPINCDKCAGHGYVHTSDHANVSLVLWWIHPRKGCSRGIEVKNIKESEMPAIGAFLMEAAQRNADRFKGISELVAKYPQP